MKCFVCPHECDLKEGQTGLCLARANRRGKVLNFLQDQATSVAIEPIEKRPFFHFLPGTRFLTVGFQGCSLKCDFCQNHEISQATTANYTYVEPAWIVDQADEKADGIAFSYNEPTVYWENVLAVSYRATEHALPVVVKTNGYAQEWVIKALAASVDAFNVDIKGGDWDYLKVCKGSLRPVLRSIEVILESGRHLEVSLLLLPRVIEDKKFLREIREWLSGLSPDIPVHFHYFYPFHLVKQRYSVKLLSPVVEFFREKMTTIYVSNVWDGGFLKERNTYCPSCKKLLIERQAVVKVFGTSCCGQKLKGTFQ